MDTIKTKFYVVTKKSHKHIPRRKKVSESEAKKALITGKYTYEVWPDNDSFHVPQEVEVDVYKETTTRVTKKL